MGLKNTLISALDGDKRATKKLCDECRYMAVAYLRTKSRRNNFLLQYLYENIEDLALDCIADLFGREDACFAQFENYIERKELHDLSESEVFTKVRRLVFSKVNEGLYRNYQKFDPSLSKIIRNLKRTLEEEKVKGAGYDRNKGEIIFLRKEKPKPLIPDELLAIKFSAKVSEVSNTVEAIEILREILSDQLYASRFKLIGFAIILRKVFAYRLEMEGQTALKKPEYEKKELLGFIEQSILKQKNRLNDTYVASGKINQFHFNKYLKVISDILKADFVEDSSKEGYFEHFEFHFPEITYERYREEYRQVLEYLVKKVRDQLILEIKREERFSRVSVWK